MIELNKGLRWCVGTLPQVEQGTYLGEFPIRDDIGTGESGHGYVLRMAVVNCLGGLPAVKKMLGKTRYAVLEDTDAHRIAGWFGANLARLSRALGSTGIGKAEGGFEFCGHSIGRSYFVNRMYPRVCALCSADEPYCKSQWELSLATTCHLHCVALIDSCPWCGSDLSWNRPSLMTCKCGGNLASMQNLRDSSAFENAISRWLAMKLHPQDDVNCIESARKTMHLDMESALTRLIKPLTLGGGMQLIYALGTAQRSDVSELRVSHRKKSSIVSASEILLQANAMVSKLMDFQHVEFRQSNLSVVVKLLAETAKANSDAADRSLALSLIYVLLRQGGRSNWKSRYPQLSQYELF
ncbi:MAG: hypothetical protein CFE43_20885 [Burkholderiales bacterium PBB3]|nr:MAG: hypothetical protein CFE43_20885 [Burkholderiales bacterium PBB3]